MTYKYLQNYCVKVNEVSHAGGIKENCVIRNQQPTLSLLIFSTLLSAVENSITCKINVINKGSNSWWSLTDSCPCEVDARIKLLDTVNASYLTYIFGKQAQTLSN